MLYITCCSVLVARANGWLANNPGFKVRSCESLELKLGAHGVNPEQSVYMESSSMANYYIRALRYVGSQLHILYKLYFILDLDNPISDGGLGVRWVGVGMWRIQKSRNGGGVIAGAAGTCACRRHAPARGGMLPLNILKSRASFHAI